MATMHEIVPVFVSSKQVEFQKERQWILAKLSEMELLAPEMMEDWVPSRRSAQEGYLERVRSAMIYVGLFGCTYSKPSEEEYRAATENRYKEILIYVRQCDGRDPALQVFLDQILELRGGHVGWTFTDWSQIEPVFERHLWDAVGRMARAYHRLGTEASSTRSHGGATDQLRQLYGPHADTLQLGYVDIGSILDDWRRRYARDVQD